MRSSKLIHRFIALLVAALLLLVAVPGLNVRAVQPAEGAQIHLQFASFDPLSGEPDLPAAQQLQEAAGQPMMALVQFSGPVLPEWKAAVEAAGVRLYDYIPDYAFLTRLDGATAETLRALPFVRWVGAYQPAYRLPASLAALGTAGESSQGLLELNVQALPDSDLDALAAQVSLLGGSVQAQSAGELASLLRVALPAGQAQSLAALDGVVWVEPYLPMTILNDVGSQVMAVPGLRTKLNLFGSGQVVAVADTGLDVGVTTAEMSDDFEGRIIEGQAICKDFTGGRTTWSDLQGHGTHVSGSVLGNGALSGGQFAGVAPQAGIIFQSIDDDVYDPYGYLECIPLNLKDNLFKPAYDKNARLHSNSWGGATSTDPNNPYGGYDDESRQADDAAWTYKNMLLLFAAGNSGVDANADGLVDSDSIGSPGTAKNVLTVGATENNRPTVGTTWGDFPYGYVEPIFSDPIANDMEGMAAFSSRGPTDDGRIKPDLVAPGTMIVSARSHVAGTTTGWGVYDDDYLYMGGTSMSTPLTAGAATLVREWLTEARGFSNPSAALMKAVLINGASDISPGQYVTPQEIPNQRPNNVTGWGRVNLQESIDPAAPRQVWLRDFTAGLATGSRVTYTINVGGGGSQSSSEGSLEINLADEPMPQSTPQPPGADDSSRSARPVELTLSGIERGPSSGMTLAPEAPAADVDLVLDDGSNELNLGLVDNVEGVSFQFIWFNRFTPAAGDFPFNLEQIQVLFDGLGGVPLGADIDLVIYQDTDGNPANGATLLRTIHDTVKAIDGTWSVYNLSPALQITGPGDVLIGVINRYVVDGVSPISYPAAIDQSSSDQQRSWVGWWVAEPPDPAALPTNDTLTLIGNVYTGGGNWLIRGYGSTVASPTPTPPPTTGGPLRLTLAWTDYPGSSASAKALVNDLDLEVVAPDGKHYYGNFGLYSSGQCLRPVSTTVKWDACNNVEGITIPNAPYGTYTVYVNAYNVPQGPQPFALVASGDYLLTSANLNNKLYLPFMRK